MSLDKLLSVTTSGHQPLREAADAVRATLENGGSIGAHIAGAVLTTESRKNVNEAEVQQLQDLSSDLHQTLRDMHSKLCARTDDAAVKLTMESRLAAAFTGMLLASDASGAAASNQRLTLPAARPGSVVVNDGTGHMQRLAMTNEAFKNYDLPNSRIFSTLFNYSIVDFDDFIRTFWRPVTISPDNSVVELMVNLLTVFNGYEHNVNGDHTDWRRNNLVRAIADHRLLHTDLTRAIPVVRTESEKYFMDAAIYPPQDIEQAGKPVTTAPLKFGVEGGNLISLASPAWLVKNGPLDQRDNLDPGVRVEKIIIALGADVLEFAVAGMPGSEFNRALQGDMQRLNLAWTSNAFVINKNSKNADGTPLADLASVVTGELTLTVRMNVYVDLNIETGEYSVQSGKPMVRSLMDSTGQIIAATDARYTAIQTALDTVKETGIVLEAYRSNEDRRQRGQLINIRQFTENVVVPWRDPIAAERPAHGQTDQDTADLTALMSATRIRIHNEGVTALLNAEAVIRTTAANAPVNAAEIPNSLGVGRYYVIPTYRYKAIDMLKVVDSLKSSERETDMQAAAVATIRNEIAHAYTDSQYKAAQDALSGGTMPKPKVALVCDPVVARYLIEPGELRTLVDFELVVVPILDFRMRNKIRMVFITDDGGTDVNYLNFGYLFWSPEQVLVANMSRTGAYNRETQVQPRYAFYVACPVMVSVDISNISEALAKISLNVDTKARP